MNNRQVNGNWAIGGETYDIARVPGGAASKGGGGGSGEGAGGAQMSTVLHISLLQREAMSVSREHSNIFIYGL